MTRDATVVTRRTPAQWAASEHIQRVAEMRGIHIPPVDETADDVEPIPAFINRGKWIAMCPEPMCFGQAEDVWRDWAYFLCMLCGNTAVGNRWRPVVFPANMDEIEAEIDLRPADDQNWHPTEPGLGGPTVYYASDDPTPFMTIEQRNRAFLAAQEADDASQD